MKNKNKYPIRICEIIGGEHQGRYCLLKASQQVKQFTKRGKFMVLLFQDKECTIPILSERNVQEIAAALIYQSQLHQIGFVI